MWESSKKRENVESAIVFFCDVQLTHTSLLCPPSASQQAISLKNSKYNDNSPTRPDFPIISESSVNLTSPIPAAMAATVSCATPRLLTSFYDQIDEYMNCPPFEVETQANYKILLFCSLNSVVSYKTRCNVCSTNRHLRPFGPCFPLSFAL